MASAPSGEQHEIHFEDQRATIVEVGGGIREYVRGAREVLEPYPLEAVCDGGHGAVLVPWPNRIGGGVYEFDGEPMRLALTEPARGNAIHGLLRWTSWRPRARERSRVVMGARIHPQPGYPFDLDVTVEYSLGPGGLVVVTTATNLGERPLPFAAGQHPYLSPGAGRLDDCELSLPAATLIATDPATGLPSGRGPVDGTPLDFRAAPRRLGETAIDSPLTDLARDGDGLARAVLASPDGEAVELWADVAYTVIQLFTGDTLAPNRRRTGLAVEPMSAPPDCFRSGEGLVRLDPGESWRGTWGALLR
ncbi:MAG TPA: aldose 1-epimerase family protein [Solirubrobacteraceae bacterium]|nr:aldose 1-epimerase family protein [Solirubrobacteraceae bacterium]